MDHGKLIALWSCEKGAGRRTVAAGLARQWTDEGRHALLLSIGPEQETTQGPGHPAPDPALWLSRFQSLPVALVRNYLQNADSAIPRIWLAQWPAPPVMREFLSILRRSYARTLLILPQDGSPETTAALDASDLLLAVARPTTRSEEGYTRLQSELACLHFPNSFIRPVLNHCAKESLWTGVDPLLRIPEDPGSGVKQREAIRELARLLDGQEKLFRPRGSVPVEPCMAQIVVNDIKSQIQPELIRALGHNPVISPAGHEVRQEAERAAAEALAMEGRLPGDRDKRQEIVARVLDEVLGLGPLEPLLKDEEVSEIMVVGRSCVYVEKRGKLYPSPIRFDSEDQLRTVIDRIVAPIGRRVDESMPLCDARLADGSRVNIVLPPLALDGASVTIRKFMARRLDLDELVTMDSLSAGMAEFLKKAVMARKNILVAGGTGSGKTTLLNALSSAIPEDERIVTIEDAAELRLQKPHVVRLECRPANAEGQGEIPIRRLVMNALRMRPDRIIVGECRGGEALDMLQAMNTGHDGSLTTVHANSPRDALGRLEALALMAGLDLPVRVVREQIRSAIHLIVQQARRSDGSRKVVSITEVTGMEGEMLVTQELFRFREGQFESRAIPRL